MSLTRQERELRRLAEEATPGPWFVHDFSHDPAAQPPFNAQDVTVSCDHPATITVAFMGGGLEGSVGVRGLAQARRDAEFISASNPQAILSLLTELEALRGVRDKALEEAIEVVRKALREGSSIDTNSTRWVSSILNGLYALKGKP